MTGAEHLAGTSPIRSTLAPTAVVWDGRVFTTHASLTRWLQSHGSTYEAWARQHPSLAAATDSAGRKDASAATPQGLKSANPDRRHLMAIGGAGFVAVVLALVLLYQRRKYDFRGRLQRSPALLATPSTNIRINVDVLSRRALAARPASALRSRIVHRATSAAITVAAGIGHKGIAGAVSRVRGDSWLRDIRERHPELAWYAAACAFATAVGISLPFLFR